MNSRNKGKRGERAWRDEQRAQGYTARRGQQFCGSPDSPDVVCDALPWIHFEVKCVERLNIEDAMDQARRDAGAAVPVVAHKRNFRRWLVTMDAETFFRLLRGDFPPRMDTNGHRFGNALRGTPSVASETGALPEEFGRAKPHAPTNENTNQNGHAVESVPTERKDSNETESEKLNV
jgi:hypothetical protein